jgi:STE24 endopeptidase
LKRFLSLATLVAIALLVIAPSAASGQSSGANARGTALTIAAKPATVNETEPVAVPQPSPQAMDYYRGGNWLWVLNQVWAILLPGVLAFSGASARLRILAQWLGRGWFLTIGLYTVLYLTIVFLIDLPLAFLEGFVRQHAYGLSNQSLARWLGKSFIGLGVDLAVGFALTWVPYLLLARSPRRWWFYTAVLSVPFLFAAMLVKPIWIDPLFNQFGPMHDKPLERSILSLAERAGIEGSRVFEVDKSADTKAVNAYVTGVFNTKRIVLWDTLIAKLREPELLVVMGHEMGHYVLGHVVRSILLSSLLTLAGLFLVDRLGQKLIARFSQRLGFDRLSDVASMPLLLMLIEVSTLVLSPAALAYSRYQEHEADQFALDLTHANHSGALSFVKLQEENLSNPRPGLFYKLFRATHPSIGDRIDFCNAYHPWRPNTSAVLPNDHQASQTPIPGDDHASPP